MTSSVDFLLYIDEHPQMDSDGVSVTNKVDIASSYDV